MSKIPYRKVKRWRKLPIQNILLSYPRSANTWLRYCIYKDSWLNSTKKKPSEFLNKKERIEIDDYIKKNYPVLFEMYLSGYEEKVGEVV